MHAKTHSAFGSRIHGLSHGVLDICVSGAVTSLRLTTSTVLKSNSQTAAVVYDSLYLNKAWNTQMMNSKIRWFAVTATVLLVLAACGGGGGDGAIDPVTGGPVGGPAGGTQRSGKMAYFFNNRVYGVDMATGVSTQLAETLNVKPPYVAHSLTPAGGLVMAFHDVLSDSSSLNIYKPEGSLDKSLSFNLGISSAPSFSPDGQNIAFSAYTRSADFNAPRVYQTVFSDRNGVVQNNALNLSTGIGWLPDGRAIYNSNVGLIIFKQLPLTADSATLVPNTKDALTFSVSPDGSKIAFTANANNLAPSHVFVVDIDGNNRRQVTDSRDQGEDQVTFSPNGKELLIGTGLCSFFNFTGQYIQVVPADGTMLDVTDGPSPYKLKVNGQTACTNKSMSWK